MNRKTVTFPAKIKKSGNGAHIMIPGRYLERIGAGIESEVYVTLTIDEE